MVEHNNINNRPQQIPGVDGNIMNGVENWKLEKTKIESEKA